MKSEPLLYGWVYVRAPEQARLADATTSMWISAAFERWQPGIDSRPATSWYADEPSASTRDGLLFVFPAQRPASPEIAESPRATTASGTPVGGAACAVAAIDRTVSAQSAAARTFMEPSLVGLPPRFYSGGGWERK